PSDLAAGANSNVPLVELAPAAFYPHMIMRRELAGPEPVIRDGVFERSTAPGLGLELDEDAVQRYRVCAELTARRAARARSLRAPRTTSSCRRPSRGFASGAPSAAIRSAPRVARAGRRRANVRPRRAVTTRVERVRSRSSDDSSARVPSRPPGAARCTQQS